MIHKIQVLSQSFPPFEISIFEMSVDMVYVLCSVLQQFLLQISLELSVSLPK